MRAGVFPRCGYRGSDAGGSFLWNGNQACDSNLAPTQSAPLVRRHPETGERHLDLLQRGLLPHFTKAAAHARRRSVVRRRYACIDLGSRCYCPLLCRPCGRVGWRLDA